MFGNPFGFPSNFPIGVFLCVFIFFWLLGLYVSTKIIASVWFSTKLKYDMEFNQRLLRAQNTQEKD